MAKKELSGSELAGFVKQRQQMQVRAMDRAPKLLIVATGNDPVTDVYLRLKQRYAEDIGAEVDVHIGTIESCLEAIGQANTDEAIDGIIVQLPLDDSNRTDEILNKVAKEKDVDGLAEGSSYDPATPTAIMWLLAGYNIDLQNKRVLVVGKGRLVGEPLIRMLEASGVSLQTADITTPDLSALSLSSEVIISATGRPKLITTEKVPTGAVIVDAGTATDNGEVVGDVDDEVRARDDVMITPKIGGVGPLTVCALFENLIRAASVRAPSQLS